VRVQGLEIGVVDLVGVLAHLHGEVEHGPLPGADVCLAVVHGHLVGDERLFLVDAQDCAMRHHAIQALIGGAGGGDDHLALALGQAAFLFEHERIVVRKEGAPFRRAAGKREEHVGDEPCLLLHFKNPRADVLGQGVQVGEGVAAHGGLLGFCVGG